MSEFKPTPGEWKIDTFLGCITTDESKMIGGLSDLTLCVNAGNTYHATGMTPSQLAERVKVLEDALRDLLEAAEDAWSADRPCVRIAREAMPK